MKKFINILFFYSVIFYDLENKERRGFDIMQDYYNEKANRYLGINLTKSDYSLLKERLKYYPLPNTTKYLTIDHLIGLIHVFDEIFSINNIPDDILFGHESGDTMKDEDTYVYILNNLNEHLSVIGSFNGVSLILGDWLKRSQFNKNLIERELSFIELDI